MTLVIGVGNRYRGDDAAGLRVVEQLTSLSLKSVKVVETDGDFASLMDIWRGEDEVFLIDAIRSGIEPGSIIRIDAALDEIPLECFHSSTHAFGVAEAIELARSLNSLPKRLIVYGIEGEKFEMSSDVSRRVLESIPKAVELILQEWQDRSGQILPAS